MTVSGGGITPRWEWGDIAGYVWASSSCCRRRSVCAVLGWARFSVSETNRLLCTREPPGCSAPHTHGWDESVWSLPHCRSHQPARQLRSSTAQAWKIRQRGAEKIMYNHRWNNMFKYVNHPSSECQVFASGFNWSSHLATEKGYLVCSVSEDACVSQREHGRACTENYRLCRSRSQCPVQGGCYACCTGKVKGIRQCFIQVL